MPVVRISYDIVLPDTLEVEVKPPEVETPPPSAPPPRR